MDFSTYFVSLKPSIKKRLAKNALTSVDYLRQIARGNRNAGFATIKKLIAADPNINISMFDPTIDA